MHAKSRKVLFVYKVGVEITLEGIREKWTALKTKFAEQHLNIWLQLIKLRSLSKYGEMLLHQLDDTTTL